MSETAKEPKKISKRSSEEKIEIIDFSRNNRTRHSMGIVDRFTSRRKSGD